MRGDGIPGSERAVDLSRIGRDDTFVGEIQPQNHPRVEAVYVVLKNNGEVSDQHLYEIGEFARAAAVAAATRA